MVNGKYRRFTPREAANIQSFPESFNLDVVSENRQYRAIGNAVPPVLMWHVANALVKCCSVDQTEAVKEKKEELINQEM
jgi:DNA (cytosine-5)-methyltransferase 1